jgi:hypothetical protein
MQPTRSMFRDRIKMDDVVAISPMHLGSLLRTWQRRGKIAAQLVDRALMNVEAIGNRLAWRSAHRGPDLLDEGANPPPPPNQQPA